jgi:hypothetical protein
LARSDSLENISSEQNQISDAERDEGVSADDRNFDGGVDDHHGKNRENNGNQKNWQCRCAEIH